MSEQMKLPAKYKGATPGPWVLRLARLAAEAPIFGFSLNVDGKAAPLASAGVYVDSPLIADFDGGYTATEVEANALMLEDAPKLAAAVVELREALHVIRAQSLDEAWTVEHAFAFIREYAKAALENTKEFEA